MSDTKPLNVWTLVYKGSRYIAAVKNREEAATIFGCNDYYLRANGELTHDPLELSAAREAPHTKIMVSEGHDRLGRRVSGGCS